MADGDLQFDKAEFADQSVGKMACGGCKKPIPDQYWQLGDAIFCAACKLAVEQSLVGGSGMWRLIKATAYGTGVGFAGAAIYSLTLWATEVNFALITIFIGIFVGQAVRAGSENRGGLTYQFLALLVTYVSMSLAFAPLVYAGLHKEREKERTAEATAKVVAAKKATPNASPAPAASPSAAAALAQTSTAVSHAAGAKPDAFDRGDAEVSPAVRELVLVVFSLVFSLVFPFYQIMNGGIMFLLIFGFGLHEAWKANAKLVLVFQGPLQVAQVIGGAPPAAPAAPADAGPQA